MWRDVCGAHESSSSSPEATPDSKERSRWARGQVHRSQRSACFKPSAKMRQIHWPRSGTAESKRRSAAEDLTWQRPPGDCFAPSVSRSARRRPMKRREELCSQHIGDEVSMVDMMWRRCLPRACPVSCGQCISHAISSSGCSTLSYLVTGARLILDLFHLFSGFFKNIGIEQVSY